MNFELSEKDVINLLNCINITLRFMKYHTRDEKQEISCYYNFDNYEDDFYTLNLLHRRISTKANLEFYNYKYGNYFIGQRDYLSSKEKDFEILKNNKNQIIDNNLKIINNRKHNNFYLLNFLKKVLTK